MNAVFKGKLGQTVEISGKPEEIATAYAYLLAADISTIRTINNSSSPISGRYPIGKSGGYVDPPSVKDFEGRNPEDIFNALLDWVNDQIRGKDGDNSSGE